ncbi:cadherin-13-like [Osmerus eperlanus]|uniref:cadherin-13-like n=1 Tax=Osmerus eperlanus TaxID=29151 RepID=UPI002E130BFF
MLRTIVMTMTALDADDPNTDNAVLRYNIVRQSPDKPSPNMFYIDPERGDIVTVISPNLLDRETLPTTQYELEIVAKDMAGSEVGLTGTATATITITDKNDHAPEFTHSLASLLGVDVADRMFRLREPAGPRPCGEEKHYAPPARFAVLRDPAGWLSVNPVRGTVNTSASLDRESPFVHDNKYTAVFLATDNGSPPATGTGTLVITLEDYNDNAPYLFPSVARVCEDAKDMSVVVVGGRDKDVYPNAGPFKIELGKQPGLEKTWKVSRVNNTHSQVLLLHSLKRANYNLPLVVTDSGMPPLTNHTEVKVQVCTCRKTWMDCSAAGSLCSAHHLLLLTLLLLTATCL